MVIVDVRKWLVQTRTRRFNFIMKMTRPPIMITRKLLHQDTIIEQESEKQCLNTNQDTVMFRSKLLRLENEHKWP